MGSGFWAIEGRDGEVIIHLFNLKMSHYHINILKAWSELERRVENDMRLGNRREVCFLKVAGITSFYLYCYSI